LQDPLVGAITLRLVNDDDWKAAVRETARAQPTKPPTHRTADHNALSVLLFALSLSRAD
jgi:hypothetical protein